MRTTAKTLFRATLDSSRCAAVLMALLSLLACGGAGPASTGGDAADATLRAPASPATALAAVCGSTDSHDRCPEGMICIGDVLGTTISDIVPLARGARPDWSLDGQRLVFHRKLSALIDHGEVVVINRDGSGETVLAAGVEPAWSPDGRRIAYASADGIAVMNADGTGNSTIVRHATGTPNRVGTPAWSPDGLRIVFVDRGNGGDLASQLYVVNIDGSGVRRLSQSSASSEHYPAWAPDGGTIAFAYDRELTRLGSVNAAGGRITTIAESRFPKSKPDWSPNGSTVAFTENLCGIDRIIVTSAFPGTSTQLIAGARDPAWSPEGAELAFGSGAPNFPALPTDLAGATSVYDRETADSFGHPSRYVFYENHARFQLQYQHPTAGLLVYSGSYSREGAAVNFVFDGWSAPGAWLATGTLDGSRLSVRYNVVMILVDFEDGEYVLRAPGE